MEKAVYSNDYFKKSITVKTSSVWIGDPCYALTEDLYDKIVCGEDWDEGLLADGDTQIGLVHGTMYGDGSYSGDYGGYYGVDAGVLAILAGEFALGDCVDDGTVIELEEGEHTLTLEYTSDGTFSFSIDGEEVECVETGDDDYEDEDWEDEDDYEDDDDPDDY